MNTIWKLQDGKSPFSKVVSEALNKGPQYTSRRGKNAVGVDPCGESDEDKPVNASEAAAYVGFIGPVPAML